MADINSTLTSLKRRIHAGEKIVGVSVGIHSNREQLSTVLDGGPYDFISIDSQHSPYDEDRLIHFSEMAAEFELHLQFRIKHTRHTYLVGNYLDLGPSGIEVPQVESLETAIEAVSNFYYPPIGVRSWGGDARLGIDVISERLDYARWWGETGVLWLQIESINAVTNSRSLALPGVDCLSFGPMDLTFSQEAHPNHSLKTVDDCVRYVVKELEGTDTVACFRSYNPELRQKYYDMGVPVLLETPVGG